MRELINLSLAFLLTISSVHSGAIYRRYRDVELPEVLPADRYVSELRKDQIPVQVVEVVEPVLIAKTVENQRSVDPAIAIAESEPAAVITNEINPEKVVKLDEVMQGESVRAIEAVVAEEQVLPQQVAEAVAEAIVQKEEQQLRNLEADVPVVPAVLIAEEIIEPQRQDELPIAAESAEKKLSPEARPEAEKQPLPAADIEEKRNKESKPLEQAPELPQPQKVIPEVQSVSVPQVVVSKVSESKPELKSLENAEQPAELQPTAKPIANAPLLGSPQIPDERREEPMETKQDERREEIKEEKREEKREEKSEEKRDDKLENKLKDTREEKLEEKIEEKIREKLDEKLAARLEAKLDKKREEILEEKREEMRDEKREQKREEKREEKREDLKELQAEKKEILKEAIQEAIKEEIKEKLEEKIQINSEKPRDEEELIPMAKQAANTDADTTTARPAQPGFIQQLVQNTPLGQLFNTFSGANNQVAPEENTPAATAATFIQALQNTTSQITNSIQQGIQQQLQSLQTTFTGQQPQQQAAIVDSATAASTARPQGPLQSIVTTFLGNGNQQQQQPATGVTQQPAGPLQGILNLFGGNRNPAAAAAATVPATSTPVAAAAAETQSSPEAASAAEEHASPEVVRNSAENTDDSQEEAKPDEIVVSDDEIHE